MFSCKDSGKPRSSGASESATEDVALHHRSFSLPAAESPKSNGSAQDIPSRRSSLVSVSSTLTTVSAASYPTRRGSLFSVLAFRRHSEPDNSIKTFRKHLEKSADQEALAAIESEQRKILNEAAGACQKLLSDMRERVNAIKDDLDLVVTQECRHCVHKDCVQRQLNMGWKKLERAHMVVDRYGEEVFKVVRIRYTEAWMRAQDTLSDPGESLWLVSRKQLSLLVQSSCTEVVEQIKSEISKAKRSLKSIEKLISRAQKSHDERPRSEFEGGKFVGQKISQSGKLGGSRSVEFLVANGRYVSQYSPREFEVNPTVVYNAIMSACTDNIGFEAQATVV